MTDTHDADRFHPRLIAMFSLLYLFAFQLLVDYVEGIYAFGLAGTSIPPEIIAVLLFFSPLLMLAFRRGLPSSVIIFTALLLAVCRAIEVMLPTLGRMLVAGIGVACFMVLLPSLIWLQSRGDFMFIEVEQFDHRCDEGSGIQPTPLFVTPTFHGQKVEEKPPGVLFPSLAPKLKDFLAYFTLLLA